jgi:hypothetical protein
MEISKESKQKHFPTLSKFLAHQATTLQAQADADTSYQSNSVEILGDYFNIDEDDDGVFQP